MGGFLEEVLGDAFAAIVRILLIPVLIFCCVMLAFGFFAYCIFGATMHIIAWESIFLGLLVLDVFLFIKA